jgi:hypothetical protein
MGANGIGNGWPDLSGQQRKSCSIRGSGGDAEGAR